MQCHRYDLSDFDGGEEKSTQSFLHAGELVERPTTVALDEANEAKTMWAAKFGLPTGPENSNWSLL